MWCQEVGPGVVSGGGSCCGVMRWVVLWCHEVGRGVVSGGGSWWVSCDTQVKMIDVLPEAKHT